jgi:hypothetical protein
MLLMNCIPVVWHSLKLVPTISIILPLRTPLLCCPTLAEGPAEHGPRVATSSILPGMKNCSSLKLCKVWLSSGSYLVSAVLPIPSFSSQLVSTLVNLLRNWMYFLAC